MTGQEIVTTIGAVFGSAAGTTAISFIAFCIKDAVVEKIKAKKPVTIKLTEKDKRDIAHYVVEEQAQGVEVDISGKLNKETANLVQEQKRTSNAIVKSQNETNKLLRVMAKSLTTFNAVRVSASLQELNAALEEKTDPIEPIEVEEETKAKLTVETKEEVAQEETPKKARHKRAC